MLFCQIQGLDWPGQEAVVHRSHMTRALDRVARLSCEDHLPHLGTGTGGIKVSLRYGVPSRQQTFQFRLQGQEISYECVTLHPCNSQESLDQYCQPQHRD
jgi:hypothetical protein